MMKAQPGGMLEPHEVVGRDGLIDKIWKTLDNQSVILEAERRLGKTSVIQKMVSESGSSKVSAWWDLEKCDSHRSFVSNVYTGTKEFLNWNTRARMFVRRGAHVLSDSKAFGIVLPKIPPSAWKDELDILAKGLGASNTGKHVVLFFDEMPLFLQKVRETEGDAGVADLLDFFRAIRHEHHHIRMVYTGSIGLHHVVKQIKISGHGSPLVNDMISLSVPPLSKTDAESLAAQLLQGEDLEYDQSDDRVLESIAGQVDCIPNYIHHVVWDLTGNDRICSADVLELVQEQITSAHDPWHLDDYETRLFNKSYYSNGDRKIAEGILSAASEKTGVAVSNLLSHVREVTRTRRSVL